MKRLLKELGETALGGIAIWAMYWVLFQAATMMYAH